MLRRTLLKLFTITPLALLACAKQIYLVRRGVLHTVPGGSDGSVWTANPQYYRNRLPDLWAPDRSLVQVMADKCLATARDTDTRAWTLAQWNEELFETKALWGTQQQTHACAAHREMRRRNEKKRSA